jgi:fumarate reductase subunit D
MRFLVLTAVKMVMFFSIVTPCGLVGRENVSEEHTVSIIRAKIGNTLSIFRVEDSMFLRNVVIDLRVHTAP